LSYRPRSADQLSAVGDSPSLVAFWQSRHSEPARAITGPATPLRTGRASRHQLPMA